MLVVKTTKLKQLGTVKNLCTFIFGPLHSYPEYPVLQGRQKEPQDQFQYYTVNILSMVSLKLNETMSLPDSTSLTTSWKLCKKEAFPGLIL